MPDAKPLTAAKVRAVLRKAGHGCAKSHTTRIRGWLSWSPGFRVTMRGNDIVLEHMSDGRAGEREAAALARYADTLRQAGMSVTDGAHGRFLVRQSMPVAA